MGHVKTDKLDNGDIGLEITYGGHESPFGGVDTSASPAYIDSKCFVSSDGFLVIDNKLVACSLQTFPTPVLWSNTPGIILLIAGTFYSSIYGQLNYALGYSSTVSVGPPYQVSYTFYMTSWNPSNFAQLYNDTLNLSLYGTSLPSIAATIDLELVKSNTLYASLAGLPTLVLAIGTHTYSIAVPTTTTVGALIALMVTAINTLPDSNVVAAPATDGLGIIITAKVAGVVGNLITVQDLSQGEGPGLAPPYYFTCTTPVSLKFGQDPIIVNPMQVLPPASTTAVGGTLYIGNLGPLILSYSGLNTLQILTLYEGVKVLKKFAGSLIGLGVTPALGVFLKNQDMIYAWSAANDLIGPNGGLREWNPVNAAGLVTGAGFAQLADVADFLTGLVVSNNTAFIIRSQGLSYATSLGSGTDPFQFAHVGLGDRGEGGQFSQLVCQYDQTGAYVGNTDVFQLSGSISAIGQKIKALLFTTLNQAFEAVSSNACGVFIGGEEFVIVLFHVGNMGFIYNPSNQTWMTFSLSAPTGAIVSEFFCTMVNMSSGPSIDEFSQSQMVQTFQVNFGGVLPPSFYSLQEGFLSYNDGVLGTIQVTFPQEELIFGRDVTIDAIYIAFYADVIVGAAASLNINFIFNGVLFNTLSLSNREFNSLIGNPVELQIFPAAGVFTAHSPQLQIQIQSIRVTNLKIRFTKIQVYGSFDPAQRPV